MLRRRAPWIAVLPLLAPACELFGLGTIYCDRSDAFCPSGFTCNTDGICQGHGWNPFAPPPPPPPQHPCEVERCGVMPDSPTQTCINTSSAIVDCPAEGRALHGQDGNYLLDPPACEEQGNSVRDLVTGLYWQRDLDSTERSWNQATATCASLTTDGRDWRLPSVRELVSMLDYGKRSSRDRDVLIDTARCFPTPSIDTFWSADRSFDLPWYVDLQGGEARVDTSLSGNERGAWCASGPDLDLPRPRYSSGLWTDDQSGLQWQRASSGTMNWELGLQYCEDSSDGGLLDWRLPSIKELETLFQRGEDTGLALDLRPELTLGDHVYWSSTPQLRGYGYGAWFVSYANTQFAASTLGSSLHVRCVRGPVIP